LRLSSQFVLEKLTMRWPRVIRKLHSEPAPDLSRRSTVDSSAQDLSNGDGDSTSKSAPPDDPSLSQMFTDAALYDRVLNAGPESLKKGFPFNADDQAIPNCLGGFNDLIGRDLGDVERAVTDRLAKLSVHNWAARIDDPFGPDTPPDAEQGERSPSEDGEDEKQTPLSIPPTLEEEPPSEPKLTPEEIIDLLEQEFGALAPPGEEKLLLETDAAFFKDVVVLVGSSPFTYSVVGSIFFFPRSSGRRSPHLASIYLSRFTHILPTGSISKCCQVWFGPGSSQGMASEE